MKTFDNLSLKPGHKVPASGIYQRSSHAGGGEVTLIRGCRVPPGPRGTHPTYTPVRLTRPKRAAPQG